ncbi:hypothetical protein GGR54DRAFT_138142 [Hypoxylon sp. NC1633]|nr:hypothetical protein GGR54DRAFT_138142 [Hypoxylon sp. NC1633]
MEFATTALTAVTATASIIGSSRTNEYWQHSYRTYASDENSPSWIEQGQQQRPPFASTRPRHTYGYYGQPLFYPSGLHEHYVHHAECPGSQCHYRAFLTDSIQRYNEARRALRQTYVTNVRDLRRVHQTQPGKPARQKEAELARLYMYYVSRVREVFEHHRHDHRRLFGQDYLCWTPPEREDPVVSSSSRSSSLSPSPSHPSSSPNPYSLSASVYSRSGGAARVRRTGRRMLGRVDGTASDDDDDADIGVEDGTDVAFAAVIKERSEEDEDGYGDENEDGFDCEARDGDTSSSASVSAGDSVGDGESERT